MGVGGAGGGSVAEKPTSKRQELGGKNRREKKV
jgi:hypothetical protein